MHNVLVVTAKAENLPALATDREIAQLSDIVGLSVTVITEFSRKRFADHLESTYWDLVLWIGHGNAGQLIANDDAIEPTWLAEQLFGNTHMVLLSVCETSGRSITSGSFADALPTVGITVITMDFEIGDKAAIAFDVAFVRILSRGASVRRAFTAALSNFHGNAAIPQLFNADPGALQQMPPPAQRQTYDSDPQVRIEQKIDDLAYRMGQVEIEVGIMKAVVSYSKTNAPPVNDKVFVSKAYIVGFLLLLVAIFAVLTFIGFRVLA